MHHFGKSTYTWPHCKNEMGSKGKITEKIAQPFHNPFDYTDLHDKYRKKLTTYSGQFSLSESSKNWEV